MMGGFMLPRRSGSNQPIGYCTTRSATMSQWNIFAVVPYCKCLVMRFSYVDWGSLLAKLRSAKMSDVGNPTHETLRGFVRVDGDAPTSATGIDRSGGGGTFRLRLDCFRK